MQMVSQVVLVEEFSIEFEESLARNAFLRDSRSTKPYVFPYKVRPRTSMIYFRVATVARRFRVWSDDGRIMIGSVPHYDGGLTCFYVHVRSTEFPCDL